MSKEKIIEGIKRALLKFPDILFAYIYGSFLKKEHFNDIDIGVYLKNGYDPYGFPVKIKEEISNELKGKFGPDFFDVKILNDTPFFILADIMIEGKIIVDNDFEERAKLAEKISSKYRECSGILKAGAFL